MTLDKRTRAQLRAHCLEFHDDDLVDPREFFRPGRARDNEHRKARQLCRQVAETLDQVLAGEMGDASLHSLRVASVAPAPDASRLLVTLRAELPAEAFDAVDLARRLDEVRGWLR